MKKTFCACLIVGMALVTTVLAAPQPYKVDKNHSTIEFSLPIMNGLSRVTGKFTDFSVDLQFDEKDPGKSSVIAVIKAASISTGIAERDKDLRTAEFFDADKYPEITFKSKRLEKRGDGLVAIGDFFMHGVTKEISLPITLKGPAKPSSANPKNERVSRGFAATVRINRSDYGMNWQHNAVPDFAANEVTIEINLLASSIPPKS